MFQERDQKSNVPEGVNVIDPESKVIPEGLAEEAGIRQVETAVKANIKNGGVQVMQTPQNQTVSITIPSDPQTLQTQFKKGNIVDAATWLAAFWIRAMKIAMHLGWQVLIGGKQS
ncbi:hypothetical protein KW795_01985 [Candidatus Microgenomates bacterium]|nr:hypothetical protein [Candidatus Microgenomates bacterium]